jgi:hypothetical protein
MFHIDLINLIVRESRGYRTFSTQMTKRFSISFILAFVLISVSAWAGSIDMPVGKGGDVEFGRSGRTDIWGSGISFSELIDGGKQMNLSWGRLFFSTGRGEGWKGNTLSFAPGGEFAVRGCLGCGHKHDIDGVLMSGTILSAKLTREGKDSVLIVQFVEHLNPALAALMKLPTVSDGEFELLLGPSLLTPSCVVSGVMGGNLSLFTLSEPPSIAVLLTGLFVLFFILGNQRFISRKSRKISQTGS